MFGIGGGEADARTHVWFDAPSALTTARVEVVVDRVAPSGLDFFALQVDFDNHTWFVAELYDGADGFTGFTGWNESGYGSSSDQQHTSWWSAQYGTGGVLTDATSWTRD